MATRQKVQLVMPEMGESVSEGTVLEWHVAEGDAVSEGDTMVEVSTDKVDAEVPAPASGTVTKILVEADETIEVGKPMAEIDPNGAPSGRDKDAPAPPAEERAKAADESANGAGDDRPAAEPEESNSATVTKTTQPPAEGGGETLEITMPEMGESVAEGTVLEWHVAEGDSVDEGETVVEISTDKVDAEVPAPAAGTITKILVKPDETIEVGKPLAEMTKGAGATSGDGAPAGVADTTRVATEPAHSPETPEMRGRSAGEAEGATRKTREDVPVDDGARATPVARRAAQASGVKLEQVKGSGLGGRITKEDVLAAAGDGGAPAAPAAAGEVKPLRGPAAMLAKAMEESRSVPTATSFRTLAVDTLDAKRKALNGVLKDLGMKVSFTHLIAWAIVKAAQEWPVMARSYA
ncbi:MAG: biotin/lipoyl-containing protein, partial [Solirubrobacterales bacterium]